MACHRVRSGAVEGGAGAGCTSPHHSERRSSPETVALVSGGGGRSEALRSGEAPGARRSGERSPSAFSAFGFSCDLYQKLVPKPVTVGAKGKPAAKAGRKLSYHAVSALAVVAFACAFALWRSVHDKQAPAAPALEVAHPFCPPRIY